MNKHSILSDRIGRAKMANALQIGSTAVSNAVVREKFPASWFRVLSVLCAEVGEDCPLDLFAMRPLDSSLIADSGGKGQPITSDTVSGS